jgi:hypothetical protein
MTRTDAAAGANAETTEAWDGPLYDRFVTKYTPRSSKASPTTRAPKA